MGEWMNRGCNAGLWIERCGGQFPSNQWQRTCQPLNRTQVRHLHGSRAIDLLSWKRKTGKSSINVVCIRLSMLSCCLQMTAKQLFAYNIYYRLLQCSVTSLPTDKLPVLPLTAYKVPASRPTPQLINFLWLLEGKLLKTLVTYHSKVSCHSKLLSWRYQSWACEIVGSPTNGKNHAFWILRQSEATATAALCIVQYSTYCPFIDY